MHAAGGGARYEIPGESGRRLRAAWLVRGTLRRQRPREQANAWCCGIERISTKCFSQIHHRCVSEDAAQELSTQHSLQAWCSTARARCRGAMTALWRDAARLGALALIWLVMVGSYWTNPAPASLAGIALPKDVGRWLNRGALCREVAGRCAKGNNCGDGVNERCGRAASAAVLRASGRCRGALAAIEPADGAAPVVARARDCLRHAYRYAFRGEGLPVPRLVGDV